QKPLSGLRWSCCRLVWSWSSLLWGKRPYFPIAQRGWVYRSGCLGTAIGAQATEDDLGAADGEALLLGGRDRDIDRDVEVPHLAAFIAHEVVMLVFDVGMES